MRVAPRHLVLLLSALQVCFGAAPNVKTDVSPRFFGGNESRKPKLKTLLYDNCGSPTDPGKLLELKINQLDDGDVVVSASGSTNVEIKPPMKAVIKMSKKAMGMWVDVPCIKKVFGSCTIPDLCHYGLDECPFKPLKDANVPCHCPIKKGQYGVKLAEFPVPKTTKNGILSGTYKARVEIYTPNNVRFACYNITVGVV